MADRTLDPFADDAAAISLKQQSLSAAAPSAEAQCAHHLGLLNHSSDTQRRDSLAYLTTVMSTHPPGLPLPQPTSVIIPAVQRLVLDGSNAVRQQLLKLLQSLPRNDVAGHSDQLLLHARAGMTHLATDIRMFALEFLEWLLNIAGMEVVCCAGGWIKTLKCFLSLLGWQSGSSGKWSSSQSFGKKASDSKVLAKQMSTLATFLRVGLQAPTQPTTAAAIEQSAFPLWHTEHHVVSERTNVYARLSLFGVPRDDESEMYEDREDRQRIFRDRVEIAILAGLEQATKGGGEMGRSAAQLRRVVKEGMADYQSDQ